MAEAIPGSPELAEFPDWVLLDSFGRTHCYNDHDAAAAAVADDATVAIDTSNNQSGYFSFTLRPPPKVSYLDLHWPYGVPGSVLDLLPAFPAVLGSDERLVLLRIVLRGMSYTYRAPDLFVYTAGGPSSPPSARRLPACTEETRGLAGRKNFLTVDLDMGILCRGGDANHDFVVADLVVSWKASGIPGEGDYTNPPLMIAAICAFSSKNGEWTVSEMLAPQPHDQGQFPVLWYSDRVVPFAGRFLCWVDYYSGILLCDFSDENSPALTYVPFPGNQKYSDEIRLERYYPESFRSVSVSQGMMHFVHIGEGLRDPCQTSGLAITIWNMIVMGGNCSWEIHRVINLDDLWMQHGYKVLGLPPLCLPEFPVVTKNDPDVLCCVLREEKFSAGRVWIITVDMKRAVLQSCVRYINEQIICNKDALDGRDYENIFSDVPLLPSDISRYLNESSGN